ncbi:MAG: hypothetical protein KKB31_07815 [Nanoarchaeota archaeon]|nr:hypothetical protein [Nanoarchaeota archaeon]
MKLEDVLNDPGKLGEAAREFVEIAAKFVEQLAKHDLTLEFGLSDGTENVVDYDAPVSDAYRRDYRQITRMQIAQASKEMSEALAGENRVAGFVAAVKVLAIAGSL